MHVTYKFKEVMPINLYKYGFYIHKYEYYIHVGNIILTS